MNAIIPYADDRARLAFEAGRVSAVYLRLREDPSTPPDVLEVLRLSALRLAEFAGVTIAKDALDVAAARSVATLIKVTS